MHLHQKAVKYIDDVFIGAKFFLFVLCSELFPLFKLNYSLFGYRM